MFGSLASYVVSPTCLGSGIGSCSRARCGAVSAIAGLTAAFFAGLAALAAFFAALADVADFADFADFAMVVLLNLFDVNLLPRHGDSGL